MKNLTTVISEVNTIESTIAATEEQSLATEAISSTLKDLAKFTTHHFAEEEQMMKALKNK